MEQNLNTRRCRLKKYEATIDALNDLKCGDQEFDESLDATLDTLYDLLLQYKFRLADLDDLNRVYDLVGVENTSSVSSITELLSKIKLYKDAYENKI